jgi:hypothetical protein
MATSPNFGWLEPDNTDLVKNGALAIRTLGDAIDASLVDLKGGTTGQVLAKASGTDMDFSWVAQDDSNAIQNAIVDAKGDIIAATANDTPSRLAVGANDTVLTADSTAATGLKWAAPAASGLTLINSTTFSGASSVAIDNIFTSTYANYLIMTNFTSSGSTDQMLQMRLRVTGSSYTGADYIADGSRSYPSSVAYFGGTKQQFELHNISSVNANNASHVFHLLGPNLVNRTQIHSMGHGYTSATFGTNSISQSGSHGVLAAMDGFTLFVTSGNIAGTVKIYGYQN